MRSPVKSKTRANGERPVGMLTRGRKSPMSPTEARGLLVKPGRPFGVPSIPPWAIEYAAEREARAVLSGSKTGRVGRACPSCFLAVPLRTGVCEGCS